MADLSHKDESNDPDALPTSMTPAPQPLEEDDMVLLPQHNPDNPSNDEAMPETSRSSPPPPTKFRGRNPRQNPQPPKGPKSSKFLRPAKEILSRIRHDPSLNEADYIVGYLDRHAPAPMEVDVVAWKGGLDTTDEEWIPQHRILYFRKRGEEGRVWDREKRLDRVFGTGIHDEADSKKEENDTEESDRVEEEETGRELAVDNQTE